MNFQFYHDGTTPVVVDAVITKLRKGEVHRYHRRVSRILRMLINRIILLKELLMVVQLFFTEKRGKAVLISCIFVY